MRKAVQSVKIRNMPDKEYVGSGSHDFVNHLCDERDKDC